MRKLIIAAAAAAGILLAGCQTMEGLGQDLKKGAEHVGAALGKAGVRNVRMYDVSVTDVSELVSEAFRFSHLVFASTTYNNGVFVNMENFLSDLKAHNFRGRKYSLIENGSWAPQAGALMEGAYAARIPSRDSGAATRSWQAYHACFWRRRSAP